MWVVWMFDVAGCVFFISYVFFVMLRKLFVVRTVDVNDDEGDWAFVRWA